MLAPPKLKPPAAGCEALAPNSPVPVAGVDAAAPNPPKAGVLAAGVEPKPPAPKGEGLEAPNPGAADRAVNRQAAGSSQEVMN